MKYILTTLEGGIYGLFTTVEQVENGYLCDNESYQTTVTGEVTVSEVPDDYVIPQATTETVITNAPVIEDIPVEPVVEPTIEGAV
jgi:hypothetical protein